MSGWIMAGDELKTAIYAHLSPQGVMDYRIYDDPADDTPYPYINQGEVFYRDLSSKNDPGQAVTIRFHAWSNEEGETQVNKMMTQIGDRIGYTNDKTTDHLTLTNFVVYGQYFDSASSIRDLDDKGLQRHGILDIRFELDQI